jgi:hypothetical protein
MVFVNIDDMLKQQRLFLEKEKGKKAKKKTQAQLFEMKKDKKELSKKDMQKLKDHSKLHKGGMNSVHMKNMKKFMIAGDPFLKAHEKAMDIDKKKKTETGSSSNKRKVMRRRGGY